MNSRTKEPILSWLLSLSHSRLFGRFDSPTVAELARPGWLSVLDLSHYVRLRDRQIVLTYFVRKLFNARRKRRIPPFILFIEEAHQFCPEGVDRSRALSRGVIEQIAREGRKFNACLVLISQRPIRLSTTALSQCNSFIIMRVINPYDLDHIAKSSEGVTRDVLRMIPGLQVGEALLTGGAVNYPLLVKVRQRKSQEPSTGVKLEEELARLVRAQEREREDLEAFK